MCISSVSISFLVNGTSEDFFRTARGLQQRDPLSLFLFNIVMETRSCLASMVEREGILQGCHFGAEGPFIPLIHYVDDTLFFLKADLDQVRDLRTIVLIFETVSGIQVNPQKQR